MINITLSTNSRRFSLQDFTRKIRVQAYREAKMLTDRIPRKPTNGVEPCLTLFPKASQEPAEKDLVEFTMKVRAGSAATAPTYKRRVARFANGTPAEWIDLLESLEELFSQNSLTSPEDRDNAIKTVLRGDSLTAYESTVQEERENPEIPGNYMALTLQNISTGLQAVATEVFPHRALAMQKQWMRRHMLKPPDVGVRKMASAVTQMNSKLIRFAGATEEDLFSAAELLEILEWTLPPSWRAKFDATGYVPTEHNKARLIAEGEQIERSESHGSVNAVTAPKAAAKPPEKGKHGKKFFCKHHGPDKGHDSKDCYFLKNKEKQQQQKAKLGAKKPQFSDKKFRKELNVMSKGKSRVKVLDQYAAVLNRERKKAKRMAATAKKATPQPKTKAPDTSSSESDSDSEMSVQVLERMEEDKVEPAKRPSKIIWSDVDSRNKCLHRHRLTSTILENVDTTGIEELAYHEMTTKQG